MTHLLHSHVLPHRLSHLCCSRSGGLSICQLPYFGRRIFCLLQTSCHQPTKPTTWSPGLPYRPIQSSSSESTWSHTHFRLYVHLLPTNDTKKLHCNVIICNKNAVAEHRSTTTGVLKQNRTHIILEHNFTKHMVFQQLTHVTSRLFTATSIFLL